MHRQVTQELPAQSLMGFESGEVLIDAVDFDRENRPELVLWD